MHLTLDSKSQAIVLMYIKVVVSLEDVGLGL